MARFAVAVPLCLLVSCLAFAQDPDPASGILPFSTQAVGTYDSVDLATGNININIPVRSKAGEIPFVFSLVSNSHAYTVIADGAPQWAVSTGFSGTPFSGDLGYYVYSLIGAKQNCDGNSFYPLTLLSIVDATRAAHPLPRNTNVYPSGASGCPTSVTAGTTDGSGLSVSATYSAYTIYDKSGNAASGGVMTNPDGATMSNSYNPTTKQGTYTDTLGTVALSYTIGNVTGADDTYGYNDAAGQPIATPFTVKYGTYTLKTDFLCSGIGETGGAAYLPSSIVTPTGAQFVITYESQVSGTVTGRIASITYPSGGSVQYTYSGGNKGVNCTSGVVPTLTRTVNDNHGNSGSWTYVNNNSNSPSACAPGSQVSCNFTVTETTPTRPGQTSGDTITHYFSGENESKRVVSDASLGILGTTETCYNGNFTTCATPSSVPTLPITQTDVYSLLGSSAASLIETHFDSYGNVTEIKSYNGQTAGTPPTGSPVMDHKIYYGSLNGGSCAAIGNHIYDKVCADEYFPNGGGIIDKETTFVRSATGHATTTNTWVSGSTFLTSSAVYNATGTVNKIYDVDGAATTFGYTDTGGCSGLLPTSVHYPTLNGISMITYQTWDCNGGVVASSTDVNGGLITYTYNDPLYRLTSVQKTNGGTNTFSYNTGTSHPWSITTTSEIDTSHTSNSVAYQDGLGRTYETLLTSDLYGSDEVDTIYDKLGQVYSVSNPHRSTSSPTDGTTVLNSYDAIGRLLELTLPNGDIIHRSYTKRSTFWSAENFSAPRFYQTDDLGRLTSVCERSTVTQANGAAPVTPCNSDYPTYPGFMTSYTYDPLNRLTQVNQSGQIRQFFYDGLSRLTEEVNPETGPKYYTYDTQNAGDLYQRTAGEPNHTAWTGSLTTYTHDVLHRLTNITYGDPYTNPVTFYWDVSSWLTGKQKGRMVRQDNTGVGGCGAPCAGEEYSYDIDGNVVEKNSWTPSNWNSGPTLLSYYAYNYLDQQTSMIDIWGTTYTTSYDAADRPTSLASSLSNSTHPPTLYTVNSYNPLGEITSSTYGHTGSGMTATAHTASYDNRGRLLTINDAVTGGSPYSLSLAYTNGLVTSANDSVNGNWSTFTYDAFNRLWTRETLIKLSNFHWGSV